MGKCEGNDDSLPPWPPSMCFMWEVLQKRNAKQFIIVLFYLPIFYEVMYTLCKTLFNTLFMQ